MFAYDVDGDGDNDVITSLAAHDFGLAWHEQVREGDKTSFRQHVIMGDRPEQNRYGLVFSEPIRSRWPTSTATGSRTSSPARPITRITSRARCGTRAPLCIGSGCNEHAPASIGSPSRPMASRASAGNWSSTTLTRMAYRTSPPAA